MWNIKENRGFLIELNPDLKFSLVLNVALKLTQQMQYFYSWFVWFGLCLNKGHVTLRIT